MSALEDIITLPETGVRLAEVLAAEAARGHVRLSDRTAAAVRRAVRPGCAHVTNVAEHASVLTPGENMYDFADEILLARVFLA